jgi:uncharacterized protein YndB with AHSA1/START domain
MTTTMAARATTQVYRVFIKATPQAIWDAITSPEWSERYGYGGRVEYQLRAGGSYRHRAPPSMLAMGAPEVVVDGEVIEADPPRKLVQTWRPLWDPRVIAEGGKRLTWEIADAGNGVTALTVTHELEGAPQTAKQVAGTVDIASGGGGWSWILSDLKTLLETGKALGG